MTQEIGELLWRKIILDDPGVKWNEAIKLYCFNKLLINIAHNPSQHDCTKYIEVDQHFIKEKLNSGLIYPPYVSIDRQLLDILTNGLSSRSFQKMTCKLEADNITHQLKGEC